MSKKRIIFIHIFIWLFAIFANLPYSTLSHDMSPRQIVSNIIAFLYLMVVFYLFYSFLVPLFLNRKKLTEFFGFSFVIVLLMPFIGYTILFFVRAIYDGTFQDFYRGYSVSMHMSGYFPVLTSAVFGSFFRVIINWFNTMNQKAELDKQKLATELDLIKSKLNPHFLFNTLNNIDSLIQTNPAQASESLIKLSETMRYLTYETASEFVELGKEVEHIKNLIELNRLRIKSPENIRAEFQGAMTTKIAPALFVPLVENAFKFAGAGINKPLINIYLSAGKGIVEFEISNNYEKSSNTPGLANSGFGILNLKKRLDLTYPGKYKLTIEPGELLFGVKLIIDTDGDKLYSYR
jgi:two-component system LytT family sensor kinase